MNTVDVTLAGPTDRTDPPDFGDRPVVGISVNAVQAKWAIWDTMAVLLPQIFVRRVEEGGCTPVLLPPVPGIEHVVERLDGLVLPGGGDLDPALYGADPHPRTGQINPPRDRAELALLGAALTAGLPVLGVCRGLQLLNVHRGGTLHQHLPDITGHDGHGPGPTVFGRQAVRLESGSLTAKVLGGDAIEAPCHHHQAIAELGRGVIATGWSDDGMIEAAELADHPFAVAVQWHAEEPGSEGLFSAFAEAARQRAARSRR